MKAKLIVTNNGQSISYEVEIMQRQMTTLNEPVGALLSPNAVAFDGEMRAAISTREPLTLFLQPTSRAEGEQ